MSDGYIGDSRFVTTRKNHVCYYCEGTIAAGTPIVHTIGALWPGGVRWQRVTHWNTVIDAILQKAH